MAVRWAGVMSTVEFIPQGSRAPRMTPPAISLIGRTLLNVLASAKPSMGEGLPGLGVPLFYSVVLVLDGEERVYLSGDTLAPWEDAEPLVPVTPATFQIEPAIAFRNQPIVDVQLDDIGDFIVVLGNHVTLHVGTPYGTTIDLELLSTNAV
jgi:hypothetical protein